MLSNTSKKIMNKDALFATLIGLGIGLLLTGIILVGPNIAKSIPAIKWPTISKITLPSFSFPKKSTPTPASNVAAQPAKHTVTIDSPLDGAIEDKESILVSGTTSKHATVIIQGTSDDSGTAVNGDGKYAGKITLVEGKNDITVTSISEQKEPAVEQITVFYTPEVW